MMAPLVCNQSDSGNENETTIEVEESSIIMQARQRTVSISIMIDDHDDDANIRSIDRSAFDNSNNNSNSSMMTIDPIPFQSHEAHNDMLLTKLNQALSHTASSTFTSTVSDDTATITNDYNENNNYGHHNYEDYNCTDGTITTTDVSSRMMNFGNTNNTTDPIIRSSFGSAIATANTSSITHLDRDRGGNVTTHATVNTNNTSLNLNTNNDPLFGMYVHLKMERQQKEEELQLQQARLHHHHQGPTGLGLGQRPVVLPEEEGGGGGEATTVSRDYKQQSRMYY